MYIYPLMKFFCHFFFETFCENKLKIAYIENFSKINEQVIRRKRTNSIYIRKMKVLMN